MCKSREKMVICFPFVGDRVGGSHVSALGLIRNLDRSRFTPLVVLHHAQGPLADLFGQEGVPFQSAPPAEFDLRISRNATTVSRVARIIPQLSSFLRGHDVALVHTNDNRMHVIWGIAARWTGVKLLWHNRSDPIGFGLRWVASLVADRVVAVSRFAAPSGGLFSAAKKCSVVHSPFDTSMAEGLQREPCRTRLIAELDCPPQTHLLGYVGNLVERKRPLVFVETIARLVRMAPDLQIVGLFFGGNYDGMREAVTARAIELGISDRIHQMGFRYPGEPWLAALDLLLVTSVREPFGRTLIEAMLLGTPVIAAASGGNLEAIHDGETGMLARPDDPDAFAAAAIELLTDPALRQSMVKAARVNAIARFGLDRHANEIMNIYDSLLESRRIP